VHAVHVREDAVDQDRVDADGRADGGERLFAVVGCDGLIARAFQDTAKKPCTV